MNVYTALFLLTFFITTWVIQTILIWLSGYIFLDLTLGYHIPNILKTSIIVLWLKSVVNILKAINKSMLQ